jgi:hypothetical protein
MRVEYWDEGEKEPGTMRMVGFVVDILRIVFEDFWRWMVVVITMKLGKRADGCEYIYASLFSMSIRIGDSDRRIHVVCHQVRCNGKTGHSKNHVRRRVRSTSGCP